MALEELGAVIQTALKHPIAQGAIGGIVTAFAVDFQAFRAWKSFREATEYDWLTALWRWFQGAIIGGVTAAGVSNLI